MNTVTAELPTARPLATPALVGNRLYLRTQSKLYAFEK